MDTVYKKYYTNLYLKTGGFIPVSPLDNQVFPGDFFQVEHGEMKIVGNIFRDKVIDPDAIEFVFNTPLNPDSWNINYGVDRPYFGIKDTQGNFEDKEYYSQLFSFKERGSFFFKGIAPKATKIINWNLVEAELILKLTQYNYSFREVYLVTEAAHMKSWTLAVADNEEAELEISSRSKEINIDDIFSHEASKAIHAKNMECYRKEINPKLSFFKAKKLCSREQRDFQFGYDTTAIQNTLVDWANGFYNFDFRVNGNQLKQSPIPLIDRLKGNELNPTTALEFFHWIDCSLDDLEKLF